MTKSVEIFSSQGEGDVIDAGYPLADHRSLEAQETLTTAVLEGQLDLEIGEPQKAISLRYPVSYRDTLKTPGKNRQSPIEKDRPGDFSISIPAQGMARNYRDKEGKDRRSCGTFASLILCPDFYDEGHQDSKDNKYRFKALTCHKLSCPICYLDTASEIGEHIEDLMKARQKAYRINIGQKVNLILSPVQDIEMGTETEYKLAENQALEHLHDIGMHGGNIFWHPYRIRGYIKHLLWKAGYGDHDDIDELTPERASEIVRHRGKKREGFWIGVLEDVLDLGSWEAYTEWGPHWHAIGFKTWLENSDIFHKRTGWIYKNQGKTRSVKASCTYLLTHTGLRYVTRIDREGVGNMIYPEISHLKALIAEEDHDQSLMDVNDSLVVELRHKRKEAKRLCKPENLEELGDLLHERWMHGQIRSESIPLVHPDRHQPAYRWFGTMASHRFRIDRRERLTEPMACPVCDKIMHEYGFHPKYKNQGEDLGEYRRTKEVIHYRLRGKDPP